MSCQKLLQRVIGMVLVLLLLVGCGTSAATPEPPGQPESCSEDELSPLGVLRSTDHGATWVSLGNACLRDSTVWAVDPTGFADDGSIVLYFVDFHSLFQEKPQILYRATSVDGVNFDTPQPAYTQTRTMVDPVVLRMPDGSVRMYVPSDQEGIISGRSDDGRVFTREDGVRITDGGMPGALVLPDNQLRMFLTGANEGQEGIFSDISSDGLNFTTEQGMRIAAPPNTMINNPQPIRLSDGSYLMLWSSYDRQYDGQPDPWNYTEMHLATSTDGFNWSVDPRVIGHGGTACLVETADGTLFIYYVNR